MKSDTPLHQEALLPPLPQQLLTQYEVLECLSRTALSETFMVTSRETGLPFVAKLYPQNDFSRNRESLILSQLNHPAIPKLVGIMRTSEAVCVIREYVEGVSLDQLELPLSESHVLDIALQLCEILIYLHGQQPPVIHRDIKPQNVILDDNGRIHLIDFEISRRYSESNQKDTVFIGTDGFAPPEQYGFGQTDGRTDIYAMGVLLCLLLTGRRSLEASDRARRGALFRVVRKCVEFAPEKRFSSAKSVKKALLGTKSSTARWACFYTVAALVFSITAGIPLWQNRPANPSPYAEIVMQSPPPLPVPSSPDLTSPVPSSRSSPQSNFETDSDSSTKTNLSPVSDDTPFSDPNFEAAIRELIGKPIGEITQNDVAWVQTLDVSNKEIENLAGIELFTSLQNLYCNQNRLTKLDVSQNTALQTLLCGENQLSELDIRNNIELDTLDCSWNQLTELDIDGAHALTTLFCYNNQLESLELNAAQNLQYLDCNTNRLTGLDVSGSEALIWICCWGNRMAELDVSLNIALTEIRCDSFTVVTGADESITSILPEA